MPAATGRVAVLGQFGIGNLGNEASLDAGLALVGRAGAIPVVVTGRPAVVAAARGVAAVSMTSPRAPRGGVRGLLGKLADAHWAWRTVRSVDVVVVPGTGVLEGLAVRASEAPLTLFWYALAARAARRPLVVLSVGVDRHARGLTRWLFARTLAAATVLSVRDDASADAAEALGVRRPVVVPDLVLGAPVSAVPSSGPVSAALGRAPRRPVVALGVLASDGIGTTGAWWDPAAAVDRFTRLARAVVALGADVVVVTGAVQDEPVATQVVAHAGSSHVATATAADLAALETTLARCHVVVAARYHNLISALRVGVPAISLGYAAKQRALLALAGVAERAHDIDDFDPDVVAAQVAALIADSEDERRRLDEVMVDCRTAVEAQADRVVALLAQTATARTLVAETAA